MKHSEQINEIAAALAKAQGETEPAAFDRKNPHFNSHYATLTSIMQSVKGPLSKNGLAVVQSLVTQDAGQRIVTKLIHSSGQWIEDEGVPLMLDKQTMQGLGSAITYAKRYGLAAMLGVVSDEDDDGEAAEPQVKTMTSVTAPVQPVAPAIQCCGRTMMISKQNTNQLYCVMCKQTKPRAA